MNSIRTRTARRGTAVIGGLLALGLGAAGLAGCAKHEPEPDPVSESPSPSAPALAPLTGEEMPGVDLNHAAVTVKVPNANDGARPQVNLNSADLVYEEQVEGGITRYVAVYHSQLPSLVGPVRSARPTDTSLVSPIGGAFVYSGSHSAFDDVLGSMAATRIDESHGDVLTRDDSWGRGAPNNLFAHPQAALDALDDGARTTQPAAQFAYAAKDQPASAAQSGDALTGLSVSVGADAPRRWTWDAAQNRWVRSTANGQVDSTLQGESANAAQSQQIAADNVVVIRSVLGKPYDLGSKGLSPRYQLDGASGQGYVLSSGRVLDVSWSKADAASPFVLTTTDGAGEVRLQPGSSWIELVPDGSGQATPEGRTAA